MLYYTRTSGCDTHLIAREEDGAVDLTASQQNLATYWDLAATARAVGEPVDAVARRHLPDAPAVPAESLGDVGRPVVPEEVWAAGVTYHISEEARESESGMPELYLDVYEADRPELFFKATPSRTVGPGEEVGIRGDSTWDVPEPELGVVLHRGEVVGYTAGNDMSSRAIEGENPLYLPQAKTYDRCCAIGPAVASPGSVEDPHDLTMSMRIERDGARVYAGETSTAEMVRTCEELVDHLWRHDSVPERAVLLTGTGLVPEDDFTLQEGDVVTIEIETIGTLRNTVVRV